jgi:hypothetical protein
VELERWGLTVLVEEELLVQSGRNAAGVGEAALLRSTSKEVGPSVRG